MKSILLAVMLLNASVRLAAQETVLPGDDLKLAEIARSSETFCIAIFEHLGKPGLGAPGETIYTNATIRVIKNIRTGQSEVKNGMYSVQAFPPGFAGANETVPEIGRPFLMVGTIVNGQLRIDKLAEPTSENVELVRQVLKDRGIETSDAPADDRQGGNRPVEPIGRQSLEPPTEKGNAGLHALSDKTAPVPTTLSLWQVTAVLMAVVSSLLWLRQKRRPE